MLVGNKMDEESGKREVAEKTGQALQVGIPYLLLGQFNGLKFNNFSGY